MPKLPITLGDLESQQKFEISVKDFETSYAACASQFQFYAHIGKALSSFPIKLLITSDSTLTTNNKSGGKFQIHFLMKR